MGYFPHVHEVLPLTYSSRIDHHCTILPLRIQDLDSSSVIRCLNILTWVSGSLVDELPAHGSQRMLTYRGGVPGYFPPVHGALLLTSSSRIGHHSTISYRYECKTLIRLNIFPLVSCSLVNEQTRTAPSACQPTGDFSRLLPARERRITIDLQLSDRHYSTILPLRMQGLGSLEYFALGVWFARERACERVTRTAPSACQPTGGFAGLLPIRPRRITIDLQFPDRPL